MSAEDFDQLMVMYFAGQLDRVQRRAFDRLIDENPDLAARFDEVYDERTQSDGLLALVAAAPELSECYAPETLQRYAAGTLDPEAAGWVKAHLACPHCRAQIDAAPSTRGAKVIRGPWTRRATAGVTALAASVLVAVVIGPFIDQLRQRQDGDIDGMGPTPVYRQPDPPAMASDTLTLNIDLPPGRALSERAEAAAEVRLGSTSLTVDRSEGRRYVAVAAGASVDERRWVYPEVGAFAVEPMMAEIGAQTGLDITLREGDRLWLLTADTRYGLATIRPLSDDWALSPDAAGVNVRTFRVVRKK